MSNVPPENAVETTFSSGALTLAGGTTSTNNNTNSNRALSDVASEDPTEVPLNGIDDHLDDNGNGNGNGTIFGQSQTQQEEEDEYAFSAGDVTCWRATKSPRHFCALTGQWFRCNKPQILSGIVVALAQIPEAVAFSFVAGVNPIIGLQSAWIMCLVTSLAGGRPGMVSGTTGAIAVVLTRLVHKFGVGHMFYAVMLAGIVQMAFGLLRLSEVIRMVAYPVMIGFCTGLGITIALAQLNNFKVPPEEGATEDYSHDFFVALRPLTNDREWVETTMLLWMIFLAVVTIVSYLIFPRLTTAIPASLAAVLISTMLEYALVRRVGYKTNTVEDFGEIKGSFPFPIWVGQHYGYADILPTPSVQLLGEIFPTALSVALVGLFESLLTLQVMDELSASKGNANHEAFSQGLAQCISAMFGGMGGCTAIGQSILNILSGGYTRLSSTVAALAMFLVMIGVYPLINAMPVASLAGLMLLVTFFTIEWGSIAVLLATCVPKCSSKTRVNRSDVVVMVVVVAMSLIMDLAIGVVCGVVLSCMFFTYEAGTRLTVHRQMSDDLQSVRYMIRGPLYFGSIKPLTERVFPLDALDSKSNDTATSSYFGSGDTKGHNAPTLATVDLENAEIFDWSGIEAIRTWNDRFQRKGTNAQFTKLTPPSHRLMSRTRHLWDGVRVIDDSCDESLDGGEYQDGDGEKDNETVNSSHGGEDDVENKGTSSRNNNVSNNIGVTFSKSVDADGGGGFIDLVRSSTPGRLSMRRSSRLSRAGGGGGGGGGAVSGAASSVAPTESLTAASAASSIHQWLIWTVTSKGRMRAEV